MARRKTNRMPMDRPDPVPEGEKSYLEIDSGDAYGGGFFCSICLNNEVVYYAPPIVDYMVGWTLQKVLIYCSTRQWEAVYRPPESKL